jgi:peptidoglycan hydrolase CwlO-like protein
VSEVKTEDMETANTEKSKYDLLREMQNIAEDIERYKGEVEKLLTVIDELELKYYSLAEQIKKD